MIKADNHQAIYAIWFARELRERPTLQNFWHPTNPSVSRQNGVTFIETLYFVLLYRVADESHGHSPILFSEFTLKTSASCQQRSNFCSLQSFPRSIWNSHLSTNVSNSTTTPPSAPLPPFKVPCVLKIAESSTASPLSFVILLYQGIMVDYQWIWWNCHEIWWSDSELKEN